MTESEFRTSWFPHHTAQFTGIVSWLAKFPATTMGSQPGQADVLRGWYRQLALLDLETAMRATDELAGSPDESLPRSFDRHPAAVKAIARRLRRDREPEHHGRRYIDGHEVFRCPTCQDTGAVTVWHPKTMALAAAGKLKPTMAEAARAFQIYECAVPCTCEASRGLGWMKATAYNPATMLITRPWLPKDEQFAELTAFVANLAPQGHAEFAQYSGRDRAAGGD